MGNQNNYGTSIIELDKSSYFPGEIVTGTVLLQMYEQHFPGNQLELRFIGFEETVWWENDQDVYEEKYKKRPNHYTNKNTGKKNIVDDSILVHNLDLGNLSQGLHKIEFKFQIPENIPGSYSKRGNQFTSYSYFGNISYQLQIKAYSKDKRIKDLVFEQPIQIVQVPNSTLQNNINQANERSVYSCCCFFKGTTLIYASINKNQFQQGQTAIVQVAIDNSRSRLGISRIEVNFRELLYLRSDKGKQILYFHKLNKTQIPGIKRGETISQTNGVVIHLPIINTNNKEGSIQTAVDGQLVKTVHEIQIICVMDGCCVCCCKLPPFLDIPITILPSQDGDSKQQGQPCIQSYNNQFDNNLHQQLITREVFIEHHE